MTDSKRLNKWRRVSYRNLTEAYQKALGEDDFAEIDRINLEAEPLMAQLAAQGWHLSFSQEERLSKPDAKGVCFHEWCKS